MNFTLKQLLYFDAAMRNGSIAAASEEMNISQSSITAAVDHIEQTVGAELFRRIPAKGILATQVGKEVGALIAGYLERTRIFNSDLMSVAGNPTGVLRLACYEPTATYVLPPLLLHIADEYPEIRIDVNEGDMAEIEDLLQTGAVDVALTYKQGMRTEYRFVPLFEAPPWALVPEDSPLIDRTEITIPDLAGLPMVSLDMPRTKGFHASLFQSHGITPNLVHSTKSAAVLRGLVAARFGHAILNICGPNDRGMRQGYKAIPIRDGAATPVYGIAIAPQLEHSTIVKAVIEIGSKLAASNGYAHLQIKG